MNIERPSLIVADAHTLGGKPRLAGTRLSVELILEHLAAGETREQLLESFPTLTEAGILACLHYARDAVVKQSKKQKKAA